VKAGITPELIAELHPRLYHMASDGAWPSIRRHGLLSTSALLDLFEISRDLREALETKHRPETVEIHHPIHGTASIRDQKPMSDASLARALAGTGLAPADWYRLLNQRVFFWTTEERLGRMLAAAPYRELNHTLLTVDTRLLLERHQERVTLSPINSGATRPMAAPRSPTTFQPIESFPYERYRISRGRRAAIVELAVAGSVSDIANLVVDARRLRYGDAIP
jgi:hypothetical protein